MFNFEKLCSLNAVSGNEHNVSKYLADVLSENYENIDVDSYGNVVVFCNKDSKCTVMLDAHIDQIGLVVKEIDEQGFVRFICSGGLDTSILPTSEVVVHGKQDLFGVVGAKPPHLKTKDEESSLKPEDMYIDCGLSAGEIKNIVSPGDTISLMAEFACLENNYYTSKSLDNRVSVYIVGECLKRLKDKKLKYNLVGSFSAQEELGCRGASLIAERIKPDIAIVIDVTFGVSPYTTEEEGFLTGKGITVAVGPNVDRKLTEKFVKNCKDNKFDFEKEVCGGSTGTNAWPIQVAGLGTKCLVISVPIKYMHTSVEMVNKSDIETAIDSICSALGGGIF